MGIHLNTLPQFLCFQSQLSQYCICNMPLRGKNRGRRRREREDDNEKEKMNQYSVTMENFFFLTSLFVGGSGSQHAGS